MLIKLKPFFTFDPGATPPCVRSEVMYVPLSDPISVDLVTRLVEGIKATDITTAEFKTLERLNNEGLVTFVDHPLHSIIGLHGVELRRALELLNNITVKIIDITQEHGDYFTAALTELGVKIVDENQALTVVIADSFTDLPNASGPQLPVIMNRFRPSIGPLMNPWQENLADQTKRNVAYMSKPNVVLPAVFNDLQRSWAVTNVFQFIIRTETAKASNIVEFNMLKMKQEWWPVQL